MTLASLLVGMILLLDAMAACPALHELIHHDADKCDHHCAATMFAQGKVDSAAIDVPLPTATVCIESAPRVKFSVFSASVDDFPPSRGPPSLLTVS